MRQMGFNPVAHSLLADPVQQEPTAVWLWVVDRFVMRVDSTTKERSLWIVVDRPVFDSLSLERKEGLVTALILPNTDIVIKCEGIPATVMEEFRCQTPPRS